MHVYPTDCFAVESILRRVPKLCRLGLMLSNNCNFIIRSLGWMSSWQAKYGGSYCATTPATCGMLHRSKRSRSREPESDRSKRSRHARSHQSRDRASPEAAPARQHTAEEDRQGSAANATSGSLPFSKAPSQPKGLVVVKAKQFDGCYSQLVDKLLDTQPRQVWHVQNQQISAKSRVLL